MAEERVQATLRPPADTIQLERWRGLLFWNIKRSRN